jgi:hypothetical protein
LFFSWDEVGVGKFDGLRGVAKAPIEGVVVVVGVVVLLGNASGE